MHIDPQTYQTHTSDTWVSVTLAACSRSRISCSSNSLRGGGGRELRISLEDDPHLSPPSGSVQGVGSKYGRQVPDLDVCRIELVLHQFQLRTYTGMLRYMPTSAQRALGKKLRILSTYATSNLSKGAPVPRPAAATETWRVQGFAQETWRRLTCPRGLDSWRQRPAR